MGTSLARSASTVRASHPFRSTAAGFLAGVLSFLILLVAVESLFLLAGIMTMLGELARLHGLGMEAQYQLTPHHFLLGLLNAATTAAGHIWSIRLGFLPLGAMGAVAGMTEHFAGHLGRRRARRVGLLAMAAMSNAAVLLWELGRRQRISEMLTSSPQYFVWQEMLLESLPTTLIVGMALAVLASLLLRELWHWCYRRVSALFAMPAVQYPDEAAGSRRWLQTSGMVLGCCLLAGIPAMRFYEREGPRTQSGDRWLDLSAPQVAVPLMLVRRPERVVVSNVQGRGQVKVYVSDSARGDVPLRQGEELGLTDDIHRYSVSEISLAGLPPATYILHLAISGQDARGLMRYIALEQGSALMGLAAWTLSLVLTGALVSGLMMAFEIVDLAGTL